MHCVLQNPIFLQNLKCVGATVIEFRFFNQITKKKKKKNAIPIYKVLPYLVIIIVSHTNIGADIEKKRRKKYREENEKKLIT